MSTDVAEVPIWKKGLVLTLPGVDDVSVARDIVYQGANGEALAFDLYRPPAAARTPLPTLIYVGGYSDAREPRVFPCIFKEMEMVVAWARLIAISGIAAVAYRNREPAADLGALIGHLRGNAASLGIDPDRIGLMATSGNVPAALAQMFEPGQFLRCAVLCYGYMLDLDGSTTVAQAAAAYQFANPGAGKPITMFPADRPLFIARAGKDHFPGINASIDGFVAAALASNLPVTLVNHASAPHGFDLFDDTDVTRAVMKQILGFLRFHLLDAGAA